MTTDELIRALRETIKNRAEWEWSAEEYETDGKLMIEVADRLEEQERIINQYHRADTFLNGHGWKWGDENESK